MKAVLTAAILLIMVLPTEAMQNDTGGFRGVGWGESLKNISGLQWVGNENGLQYFKPGQANMTIAGVQVRSILYAFWNEKFILVKIIASDDNAVKLFRACIARFGPPKNMSSVSGEWEGYLTVVKFSREAEETELVLASKKLLLTKFRSDQRESLRKKGW